MWFIQYDCGLLHSILPHHCVWKCCLTICFKSLTFIWEGAQNPYTFGGIVQLKENFATIFWDVHFWTSHSWACLHLRDTKLLCESSLPIYSFLIWLRPRHFSLSWFLYFYASFFCHLCIDLHSLVTRMWERKKDIWMSSKTKFDINISLIAFCW